MRSLTDIKKHSNTSLNADAKSMGLGGVGRSKKHESADKQVTGEAQYIDDRPELRDQLHAAIAKCHCRKTG